MSKKRILVLTVLVVFAAIAWVAAANTVDQKSVLAGRVLANGLTAAGAQVREGDILVNVESITGSAPAARANCDGRIAEVLVKPGDSVRTGDVLVRIVPVR